MHPQTRVRLGGTPANQRLHALSLTIHLTSFHFLLFPAAVFATLSLTYLLDSCLLVAQDREEIYLVIGEWDALYEEYALEGRFSDANIRWLDKLRAERDPALLDAGFLTLNVYGPFGGVSKGFITQRKEIEKLSTNLLALSLHLSQASCSPSSRRVSPAGSIQLPAPRDPGRPCCAGCTCDCRCGKAPRRPSETSDTQRGRREDSRGGSRPREPSTKRTASRPSQDSGRREATPTRDQRPGAMRIDEARAASIRDQRLPGAIQAQAQAHDNLPIRGRRTAVDPRGGSSEAMVRSGRSKSRGRDTAALGHHGEPPSTTATLPRPPPLPQGAGTSVQVPGQQQQHQGQRPPHGQAGPGTQQHRDPRYAPPPSSGTQHQGAATSTQTHPPMPRPQIPGQMAGTLQQPPHDPFHGPGPSYQAQAGPSSLSTPSRPPVPGPRVPSQPQRDPEETPVKKKDKKNTPLKSLNPFKKKKDKEDKK